MSIDLGQQDAPRHLDDASGEATIGQLVASATRDISALMRGEIALAKAELTQTAKNGGLGAGMFAGALFFALFGLGFLLTAGAWGLVALGLAPGWAFLIVAGVLFLITAILAVIGKKQLDKVGPPKRAIESTQASIQTLKGAAN